MKTNQLHTGTSGWFYKDWKGVFYDQNVSARDYLIHYAQQFNTVEIDSTFYGIPKISTVERWYEQTPNNFTFSPKTPQIITHEKRLENCLDDWQQFLGHMKILKSKLGPIVLQFDYKFNYDEYFPLLSTFLMNHSGDARLCVEIRNKNWHRPEFYRMLKEHNTALVLNDLYYMPRVTGLTADFTYIRLLGNRKQIPNDFSHARINRDKDLDWWSRWIEECLEKELEVYVYSNNRYQGHAPTTIQSLIKKIRR